MPIHKILIIAALICMVIAVRPPANWNGINWMCASFCFLIATLLV